MKIAVIGAGAAGSFCAIELKRRLPSAEVEVFEGGRKALAKVALTGGGRCNLSNSFDGIADLRSAYPRGDRLMKRAFKTFDQKDTWQWFENEGVLLTLQDDGCVFPASQNAMEIVDLLLLRMRQYGVTLRTGHKVVRICSKKLDTGGAGNERFSISFSDDSIQEYEADSVVVTTGGSPKLSGLGMLDSFGLEISPPVPSLFSFSIPDKNLRSLMGAVVDEATVSFSGTSLKSEGTLLITDWGLSGPAVLKLSSYGARFLADHSYNAELSINWLGSIKDFELRERLSRTASSNPKKLITNCSPAGLSSRLWAHLVGKSGIRDDSRWAGLGSKGMNRLVNTLVNDTYQVEGQNRFKDEFVTCGGVGLSNVSLSTLESKTHPGLYFAGEVLDVDAITGGFNLQAAWSMGHLAADSIAQKYGQEKG